MTNPAFPQGLRVFLRTIAQDNSLHYVTFPEGRDVQYDRDFVHLTILDKDRQAIGLVSAETFNFLDAIPSTPVEPVSDVKKN